VFIWFGNLYAQSTRGFFFRASLHNFRKRLNGKCSNMKSNIFWDGVACSPVEIYRRFGGYTFIFMHLLTACFFLATCFDWLSTLKTEAICSSETSENFYHTTRSCIPEDNTHHRHRCENLEHIYFPCFIYKAGLGAGEVFLFSTAFRTILGPTQPPIQWVPENLSPRVKRTECETDHSLLSSAEVKTGGDFSWRGA
jgi:hypothetical protein